MHPSQQLELPSELKLMQMGMSYFPSRVLSSAIQLQVFSNIKAGAKTAVEIARRSDASVRGMTMLLDALAGLQLLEKNRDLYKLSAESEQFLCKDSADYLGAMYENDRMWQDWGQLTECVRTGRPINRLESQQDAEEFFPVLIKSLHIMNRGPAAMMTKALGVSNKKGNRVLDVGCGSAVWSLAVADADREARVTAQDYPGVLEHTRRFVKQHEMSSRYEYLAGDMKTVDFGKNKFDLAILGNIVHSEGERSSRDLFQRLHAALVPGGKLVVIDMIPNNERSAPPFPLFFALTMLLGTSEGSTYTVAEYTEWLKTAGFAQVDTADIRSHSPLVIAKK